MQSSRRHSDRRRLTWLHTSTTIFRNYKAAGAAFENLVLEPGEVRNVGDIRIKPPAPGASSRPGT